MSEKSISEYKIPEGWHLITDEETDSFYLLVWLAYGPDVDYRKFDEFRDQYFADDDPATPWQTAWSPREGICAYAHSAYISFCQRRMASHG